MPARSKKIQVGDLMTVGPHRFLCSDLDEGAITSIMTENGEVQQADLIYMDPPWGAGNTKYWHTMNVRKGQADYPRLAWEELRRRFVSLAARVGGGPVILYGGLKEYESTMDTIAAHVGIQMVDVHETYYTSGSKRRSCMQLVAWASGNVERGQNKNASPPEDALEGQALDDWAVEHYTPNEGSQPIVLDMFTGFGRTAQAVKNASRGDLRFFGIEPNPKRLQRAIDRFR